MRPRQQLRVSRDTGTPPLLGIFPRASARPAQPRGGAPHSSVQSGVAKPAHPREGVLLSGGAPLLRLGMPAAAHSVPKTRAAAGRKLFLSFSIRVLRRRKGANGLLGRRKGAAGVLGGRKGAVERVLQKRGTPAQGVSGLSNMGTQPASHMAQASSSCHQQSTSRSVLPARIPHHLPFVRAPQLVISGKQSSSMSSISRSTPACNSSSPGQGSPATQQWGDLWGEAKPFRSSATGPDQPGPPPTTVPTVRPLGSNAGSYDALQCFDAAKAGVVRCKQEEVLGEQEEVCEGVWDSDFSTAQSKRGAGYEGFRVEGEMKAQLEKQGILGDEPQPLTDVDGGFGGDRVSREQCWRLEVLVPSGDALHGRQEWESKRIAELLVRRRGRKYVGPEGVRSSGGKGRRVRRRECVSTNHVCGNTTEGTVPVGHACSPRRGDEGENSAEQGPQVVMNVPQSWTTTIALALVLTVHRELVATRVS